MLKIYTKLEDVPEALREHYKLSDGRYVPDLSDDHPVLVHNKTLLSEKSQATAKVAELTADIEEAKKTSIPRGHVAVAKADAELLSEVKALGSVADIKTKLTEHETLKTESAKRAREDNFRLVAKELGYNEAAFLQLSNLPDMEIRDVNGKKSVVALVKNGESVTEKSASEFIESGYAPLLPALKAGSETTVPTGGSGNSGGKDVFASAKDFAKSWNESAKAGTNVAERFGVAKSA